VLRPACVLAKATGRDGIVARSLGLCCCSLEVFPAADGDAVCASLMIFLRLGQGV
jgi:hypothetical protein